MRCAIMADIHANLAAFQAVLEDAQNRGGFDEIWHLGDVVGYGPDPDECIQLLRHHRHLSIAGNHDWAAIGKIDTSDFNRDAAAACHWTTERLTPEDVEYLRNQPEVLHLDDFTIVHGSPMQPIWEYILSVAVARTNFAHFETRFCLIGHSHIPMVFSLDQDDVCQIRGLPSRLSLKEEKSRLIINCGGVGQPRDHDPRASYAILDTESGDLYHYRVDYDISATQQKMTEAGLPSHLFQRLSYGW
ncbi:MAG: hypothetical protein A2Y91_01305 [Chloroflexi bacterium RBG_13_54_8]|nr:MAG: hypothetical protein A2Y91_01305 [Chloroflexi bacterium RBG_13_54_8]